MKPAFATSDPAAELSGERLAAHAYALDASGWTVIRSQLDAESVDALRADADRALDATRRAIAEGRAGGHTTVPGYTIARRFYRWGETALALLEHPAVHALGSRMLGAHHLFDCSVNATRPSRGADGGGTGWHRDFGSDLHHGSAIPSHLFLLFCLDDLTAENGGTWVVPGSHRRCLQPEPEISSMERYPSAMRIEAQAGDLVALDPATLHASGLNRSGADRRLAAVNLCHGRIAPACDHWRLLGDEERARCSPRVRGLLSFPWDRCHAAWAVLPDGQVQDGAAAKS
jgi:ectoine hydroxylase-related dioxygenase (phytanoyl-CoA dioxygenase family)